MKPINTKQQAINAAGSEKELQRILKISRQGLAAWPKGNLTTRHKNEVLGALIRSGKIEVEYKEG